MTAIDTERGNDGRGAARAGARPARRRTDEEYDDARQVYNGAVDRHPWPSSG